MNLKELNKEMETFNIEELNKERAGIFKKWDDLDNVIHILEATANTYYSCLDKDLKKGWDKLLTARDKLKPFIESEIVKLQEMVDVVDTKIKELKDSTLSAISSKKLS